VGIQYLDAWLRGRGAVPLYHLMEDAATAEISRTQLWQWIRHGATLVDGRTVTHELVGTIIDDEVASLTAAGLAPHPESRDTFRRLVMAESLADFLTLAAYPLLDDMQPQVVVTLS
jgi:malate synthase